MTALIVFAHGSPLEAANAPVRSLARAAAEAAGYEIGEAAFLDSTDPRLAEAVGDAVARGARRVVIVPYFLTAGLHIRRDLPGIAGAMQDIYPQVEIGVAPPLEGHPALLGIVLDRAKEALDGGGNSEGKTG